MASSELIHGRTLAHWRQRFEGIDRLIAAEPCLWINPDYLPFAEASESLTLDAADIEDAEARLARFAAYIANVFPETRDDNGLIESPLQELHKLPRALQDSLGWDIPGRLLLKCDHQLAIAGSVKARGGIYEVLKHAETLAIEQGLITTSDDYAAFDSEPLRKLFSDHAIAVGSTGNLGLSIGIISAQLGFRVQVHMSADARQWKKDLLRGKGVEVVEYPGDYGEAVKQGRANAKSNPKMHFVDDENSSDLFLGYAVAARRLAKQLKAKKIIVSAKHPLFVYLPCGVGGAPGGIAFGLKQEFGDHVHCFFAEPTNTPCMLLGMMSGLHELVDVRDFGLSGNTEADGLAVARPSGFVGRELQHCISGVYTIQDPLLFRLLRLLRDSEGISMEPSALAGFSGPAMLMQAEAGEEYLEAQGLEESMEKVTHLVWGTGGSLVPEGEMEEFYRLGGVVCG